MNWEVYKSSIDIIIIIYRTENPSSYIDRWSFCYFNEKGVEIEKSKWRLKVSFNSSQQQQLTDQSVVKDSHKRRRQSIGFFSLRWTVERCYQWQGMKNLCRWSFYSYASYNSMLTALERRLAFNTMEICLGLKRWFASVPCMHLTSLSLSLFGRHIGFRLKGLFPVFERS